jgi:hypothetical protein
MAGRKKIQSKKTGKGRKNLQAKAATQQKTEPKKRGRKPGPKPKTKTIVGYKLLKRDENRLVKSFAALEKDFESFAEALNKFCYENSDKKQAAMDTNKTVLAFGKKTTEFKKALKSAKDGLKPVYS